MTRRKTTAKASILHSHKTQSNSRVYNAERQKHGNYRQHRQESWYDDRYENDQGWDTDIESISSDASNNYATKKNMQTNTFSNTNRYQHARSQQYLPRNIEDRRNMRQERQYDNSYNKCECHSATRQSRGRATQQANKGRKYYSNSSSESPEGRSRKVRSGISAKPTSSVKVQQTYPHFSLGQVSGYIGQNLQFHNLTYEQFMAGEMVTITSTENLQEAEGRMLLLQRIALWRLRANVSWPQVRNTYAHIIRKIENQEIDWQANWDSYKQHIYDKIAPVSNKTKDSKKTGGNMQSDFVWYCKAYQKPKGCPKRLSTFRKNQKHIQTSLSLLCNLPIERQNKKKSSRVQYRMPLERTLMFTEHTNGTGGQKCNAPRPEIKRHIP